MVKINIHGDIIKKFIVDVLRKENVCNTVAEDVAEGLVSTSLRGVDSHGIRLLGHYISSIKSGRINPNPNYKKEKKQAVMSLDADHTFGHAACMEAARDAVDIAEEFGVCFVSVKNSTHFGAAAYYSLYIASKDMIGICGTNADSLVVPSGGISSFLGTNPIAFAAPIDGEDPFLLDMATSIVTYNKICRLRDSGVQAPEGVGVDVYGNMTTDPHLISSLLPIGDYKGYGLGLMIEILCSTLSGMPYGPNINKMFEDLTKKRFLGQFVIAIDIKKFIATDLFKVALKNLVSDLRNQEAFADRKKILVPGDPEKQSYEYRIKNGIPLSDSDKAMLELLQKNYESELDYIE